MSRKKLLAGTGLLIAIVIMAALLVRLGRTNRQLTSPSVANNSIFSTTTTGNHSRDDDLQLASNILTQLDAHRDSHGFYGQSQTCIRDQKQNYVCEVDTLTGPDGEPLASFRQGLAVIWARFQYYAATRDTEQLKKLESDLEMMHQLLGSDTYELQTDRFNCLLMADLYTADFLPQADREMAKDLCDYAYFEVYPQSIVTYDQHAQRHPTYQIADQGETFRTNETIIESNPDIYIPAEQRQAYTREQLVEMIDYYLAEYVDEGQIMSGSSGDELFFARRFLTRELFAALDQAVAYQLNAQVDPERAAITEVDYLLLTLETLQWWGENNPDDFSWFDNDTCLLATNLEYYINNYTTLPSDTATKALERLREDESYDLYTPACALARSYLAGESLDKQRLLANIQLINTLNETTDFSAGYLYALDEETYLNLVETNAWVAGLAAK